MSDKVLEGGSVLQSSSEDMAGAVFNVAAFPGCRPRQDGTAGSAGVRVPAQPGAGKSPAAVVVDSTFDRLAEIEGQLEKFGTQKLKPASLKGRLTLLTGMIDHAEKTVQGITAEAISGGDHTKLQVTKQLPAVRAKLVTAQSAQMTGSLAHLGETVQRFRKRAEGLSSEKRELERPGADPARRDKLYGKASGALAELEREIVDWDAQVKEVGAWLGNSAPRFATFQAALRAVAADMGRVIAATVPKLLSKPGSRPDTLASGPGIPTVVISDAAAALAACGNNWVTAKQVYGTTPGEMQKLSDHRKEIVDGWLVPELRKYMVERGTGWESVGSTDPTSDYDISIKMHGNDGNATVFDYEMVTKFNAWFRDKFKAEPGTMFDTNLYASAPKTVTGDDKGLPATNDVAALMKMRRYMSGGEFEAFRAKTLAGCSGDAEQYKLVDKQFTAADANYAVVLQEIVATAKPALPAAIQTIVRSLSGNGLSPEQRSAAVEEVATLTGLKDRIEALTGGGSALALANAQEELETLARDVEHHLKDSTLLTTNTLYVNKVGEVRIQEQAFLILQDAKMLVNPIPVDSEERMAVVAKLADKQRLLAALEAKLAPNEGRERSDFSVLSPALDAGATGDLEKMAALLGVEVAASRANIDSAEAISRFFANEAYQSDGPFQHIVHATQAAAGDAKAKLLKDRALDETAVVAEKAAVLVTTDGKSLDALTEEEKKVYDKRAQAAWDAEVKAAGEVLSRERKAALPATQLLDSFNEQLGDFLKDLDHYGEEVPGKAFIQSSKYLERLLDALLLMKERGMLEDDSIKAEVEGQVALHKIAADALVKGLRKAQSFMVAETGDTPPDPAYQEQQRRALACEIMDVQFGVTSVTALGARYVKLGVNLNAAARSWLAASRPSLG